MPWNLDHKLEKPMESLRLSRVGETAISVCSGGEKRRCFM